MDNNKRPEPPNYFELQSLIEAKQESIRTMMRAVEQLSEEDQERFEKFQERCERMMEQSPVVGLFALKIAANLCDLSVYNMQASEQEPAIMSQGSGVIQ